MLRLGERREPSRVGAADRGRPGRRHRAAVPACWPTPPARPRSWPRRPAAIRRAANGGELVDRIRAETGVHVEVIGGLEEARLIFGAVRASVVLDPAPALCFDLGGGSLEVMVGDTSSLDVGGQRAARRRAAHRRLRADRSDLEGATAARCATTSPRRSRPSSPRSRPFEPKLAVGSSGTLESLAEMVAARRDEDTPATLNQLTIDRSEFLALHQELMASKAADRLRIDGLDARRVDLIVAGSMVLATAMEQFGFDQLTISEWALREGIVLDAVGRHDPDRLVRRPARDPRQRGARPGPALQLAGDPRAPGRQARARALRRHRRGRTASTTPTASCSSSPRCCTTSASTSPAAGTTSTARTSCATGSSAGSPPTRWRCWPRSCAGTDAASHA